MAQKRRLFNLLKESDKCFWCGTTVRYITGPDAVRSKLPPDAATVDHIWPRPRPSVGKTVLACHRCNQARNTIALKRAVGKDLTPTMRGLEKLFDEKCRLPRPAGP